MENPCNNNDLDFFYASTTITVGNGERTPFWSSSWLHGRKPMDIAPLIFEASVRKNRKVSEALKDDAWIIKISPATVVTPQHISQFFTLWSLLHAFHLDELSEDGITWKHTENGEYSSASAYKAQFQGLVRSSMSQSFWKAKAPPQRHYHRRLAP